MSEPILRDAVLADLPRIVEIYNASIPGRRATADTEPVTVAQRSAWFHAHDARRRPLWVLLDGGRIAAWASLSDFYGRPAYARTAEPSVYVAPEFQGRGYGPRLLNALIAACPRLGIDTLLGFTFAHNDASRRMQEAAGFRQWGYLPAVAELDGVRRDLAIFGLRVTAQSTVDDQPGEPGVTGQSRVTGSPA